MFMGHDEEAKTLYLAHKGEPVSGAEIPSRKGKPAWDYEFACLLAGDASEEGSLQKAWEAIPKVVKSGFWEGANIYVMIIRGASKS
jgi:hypothetical protein